MYWNPSRVAVTIPGIHIDIFWYSIFFAAGLFGGYKIALWILQSETAPNETKNLSEWFDRLILWIIVGILAGARLGHVLFYEPTYYWAHPEEILLLRNGGLASHGGILGLLTAAALFWKKNPYPAVSWRQFLDAAALASTWTAACIRVGNFFNQEIIGTETSLPTGIIFGSPAEGLAHPNRAHHPVQLYEAASALALGAILFAIKKRSNFLKPGQLAGIYLVLLFLSRLLFETIKQPQSHFDTTGSVHMGQLLSIPYIIYGLFLLNAKRR